MMQLSALMRSLVPVALGVGLSVAAHAELSVRGHVLDTNGRAVVQAQVTVHPAVVERGATAVTVFTDERGQFAFPEPFAQTGSDDLPVLVRALGFRQLDTSSALADDVLDVTVVLQGASNQAGVAPASAWLKAIEDPADRAEMVMLCVACHQHPPPEVRAYAGAIDAVRTADPAAAREQSWASIANYMGYLYTEMRAEGDPDAGPPDHERAYAFRNNMLHAAVPLMTRYLGGRLDELRGYDHGAPLIVNGNTVIREYEIPAPNAIREAIKVGNDLWVADVNANRVIRIDAASGSQRDVPVPADVPIGPHTLVQGTDDSLWVAPNYNGVLARLDPATEAWSIWSLADESGTPVGMHDLTFDSRHELAADTRGRIWFSDSRNDALGYFNPDTGEQGSYPVPAVSGREGRTGMYGIVMTSDRQHVWYTQLAIATFGSFNTETLEFEQVVTMPDINSGPRRLAISEDDILYVPLYGAGQLVEYDTRAGRQLAIHDLPDRASAPYAVTWDGVRQVLWVSTSNADAIYRFEPRGGTFGVLPLPREQAFLRMLAVDRDTGLLVSSYANVPVRAHGPRMAITIDPGDGYRPDIRLSSAGLAVETGGSER